MGLAASQGRYLCLTARMSDLVYEAQQISQQRLNLATETQQIAEKYSEATNNKIMVANFYDGSDRESTQMQLTYGLLTKPTSEYGLGYRLVDKFGNVVVPSTTSYMEVISKNEDGTENKELFYSKERFREKYLPDVTFEDDNYTLSDLKNKFYEDEKNKDIEVKVNQGIPDGIVGPNDRLCIDENVTDAEYLQMMISSGEWIIQQVSNPEPTKKEWEDFAWQGSTSITEIYDTTDDAAAEAEYEADMRALEKRDKILELRLEQVQTEENAVETEIESIKGVIDKNIENSFKTFA